MVLCVEQTYLLRSALRKVNATMIGNVLTLKLSATVTQVIPTNINTVRKTW